MADIEGKITFPLRITMDRNWIEINPDSCGTNCNSCTISYSFSATLTANLTLSSTTIAQVFGEALADIKHNYKYYCPNGGICKTSTFEGQIKVGNVGPSSSNSRLFVNLHNEIQLILLFISDQGERIEATASLYVSSESGCVSWRQQGGYVGGSGLPDSHLSWTILEEKIHGESKFLISQGYPFGQSRDSLADPNTGIIKVFPVESKPVINSTVTWATDQPPIIHCINAPIKVGVGLDRTTETPVFPSVYPPGRPPHRVTASIYPKSKANSVKFETNNSARAIVSEVDRKDLAKIESPIRITPFDEGVEVTLEVIGVSATPVCSPNGDSQLLALYRGQTVMSRNVIVLIPSAIHTLHPEYNGPATITCQHLSKTTRPSAQVPDGYVLFAVIFGVVQTITVADQFGDIIHPVYGGAKVYEYFPDQNGWTYINQRLSAVGTYEDPVGFVKNVKTPSGQDLLEPYYISPGVINPNIQAWSKQTSLPSVIHINKTTINGDVKVKIDEHILEPSIENRLVYFSPPDQIMILWP